MPIFDDPVDLNERRLSSFDYFSFNSYLDELNSNDKIISNKLFLSHASVQNSCCLT